MSEFERNPIFGRVASTQTESIIDPRAAALAPEQRLLYEKIFKRREGKQKIAEEGSQWNDFIFALMDAHRIELAPYAKNQPCFQ